MSSNDPVSPRIVLTLKGEVIREVDVIPRAINFGRLGKGQTVSKDLTITLHKPDKIRISAVTVNNHLFSVESKKDGVEGTSRYAVKFLGNDALGRISATLHIELEGIEPPIIRVPLTVSIEKDLHYTKSLYFIQSNGSYPSREVYFTTLSGEPVNILKVEDTGGLLKTSVLNRKGSASVLKAEVADSKTTTTEQTYHRLIITTDHKEESKVEIPYSLVIPQRR